MTEQAQSPAGVPWTRHPMLRRVRCMLWRYAGAVPIRTKIMGIVLGLVLALGMGITWQVGQALHAALVEELNLRAISIAGDLAESATDHLLTNNVYRLHQITNDTLTNNPDVRYAFVIDQNGQVLAHTFGRGFPRGLLHLHDGWPMGKDGHILLLDTEEGTVVDVATPVFDGKAGVARVGLTQGRIHALTQSVTMQLLLATAFVSLVGVGAAYLLTLVLTAPILELVQVTRAIGTGDFNQRARIWASDEIGRLAEAINAMAASQLRARQELQSSHALALRRNRELTALNAVAERLTQGFDANRLTADALKEIARQLGLQQAAAIRFEPGTGKIVGQVAVGNATPEDLQDEDAFRIPLVARNRELGVLLFWGTEGQPVDEEDRPLLFAAGQQIAVAIESALLWEEVQRKEVLRGQLLSKVISAQEEERKRIARGLHDETGQALTSVMVGLRLIESRVEEEENRTLIGCLRNTIAATLDAVRQLARDLRPSVLDDLGLVAALERYVRDYARQQPFAVDFHGVGLDALRLAAPVETALYRIAQEALTNAARHANPTSVSVVLERRRDSLILIVEDDGCGFDVGAATNCLPEQHLGLHGMRERAELLGARLTIESIPGAGTTVFVEVAADAETARALVLEQAEERVRP